MTDLNFRDRIENSKIAQRRAIEGSRGGRVDSLMSKGVIPAPASSAAKARIRSGLIPKLSGSKPRVAEARPVQEPELSAQSTINLAQPLQSDIALYVSEYRALISVASTIYGYTDDEASEMLSAARAMTKDNFVQVVSAVRQWRVDAITWINSSPSASLFKSANLEYSARTQFRIDVLGRGSDENGNEYESWVPVSASL